MTKSKIDMDQLYVSLEAFAEDDLRSLLWHAIELLPKTRLPQLLEGYVDLESLQQ